MFQKTQKPRSGFTLIELLVVIAIIAILAAILFPVFAQARSKARQITGTSNIKQVALSILMYSQDYDEKFPRCGYGGVCYGDAGATGFSPGECNQYGSTDWQNVTAAYVKNLGLYVSPGDASQGTQLVTDWGWHDSMINPDGEFSLLYNDYLAHEVPSKTLSNGMVVADSSNQVAKATGQSLAAINGPADCVLLAEGHGGWIKGAGKADPTPDASGVIQNPIPGNATCNKWHKEHSISGDFTPFLAGTAYDTTLPSVFSGLPMYNGGASIAFVDGHAKWIRVTDANARPTLCSTLPWTKSIDPLQRGADNVGAYCDPNGPNPVPGGWGTHANWY